MLRYMEVYHGSFYITIERTKKVHRNVTVKDNLIVIVTVENIP